MVGSKVEADKLPGQIWIRGSTIPEVRRKAMSSTVLAELVRAWVLRELGLQDVDRKTSSTRGSEYAQRAIMCRVECDRK